MTSSRLALALVALCGCGDALVSAPQPTMTRMFHNTVVAGSYVSSTAYQHYLLAQIHRQAGRKVESMEELRQAIAADPASAYLRGSLGEELLALGHLDEARDEAELALRLDPDFPEGHLLLAQVHLRLGDSAAFQTELERAIAVDRSCAEAYEALAAHFQHQGDDTRANDVWRELVRQVPSSAAGHEALGRLALGRDNRVAEQHLRRAVDLGRDSARFDLAMLLRGDGRTKEALGVLERLMGSPSEQAAEELAVRWLVGDGMMAEARTRVDRLEEADATRRLWIGHLRLMTAQPDEARRLGEAVKSRRLVGEALAAAGHEMDAVGELRQVPPSSADFVDAQELAAHLLARAGHGREAVELLARSGKHSAENLERLSALVLEESGDVDGGLARLRAATLRWPDSPSLSAALTAMSARQGHWERGAEEAQRFLLRKPNAALAGQLGALWAEHNVRLPEARRLLERALVQRPSDGNIVDGLGWLAARQGRLDDALALLERADRLSPSNPDILGHLGAVHALRADKSRAVEAYKRALASRPSVGVRRVVEEQLLLLERGRLGAR